MENSLKIKLSNLGIKEKRRVEHGLGNDLKNIEGIGKYGEEVVKDLLFIIRNYGVEHGNWMYTIKTIEPSPLSEYGYEDVVELYNEEIIKEQLESYEGRMMKTLLPIGEGHGGDLVCLNIKDGKVYYWFHEEEYQAIYPGKSLEGVETYKGNLYLIRESLTDFYKGLEILEEDDEDTLSEGGRLVWMDEELHKELLEYSKKYK